MMKPSIGILLDEHQFKGIPRRRTGYEKIGFYNKAAKKYGLIPFYMTLSRVHLKQGTAEGYMYREGSYRLTTRRIPLVIHNRSMPFSGRKRVVLKGLLRSAEVFNGHTRYSKYLIHRLLWKNKKLRTHLPDTKRFTKHDLKNMMARHQTLYIKPVSGSIGKGIIKACKKQGDRWEIQMARRKLNRKSREVFSTLQSLIGRRSYLVQEAVPLAKHKGRPFDIRVSVQKSGDGRWKVVGMIGKVAAKGRHVTNVAKGGSVKNCSQLFRSCGLGLTDTKKRIRQMSLQVAKHLGKKLRNLADIGLDVGVDRTGHAYFIEMNGRDLRYSFGNGKQMKTWYKTFENPIQFGKYLYRLKRIK